MAIEIDFINTAEPASYRFVIDPTSLRMNIERHLLDGKSEPRSMFDGTFDDFDALDAAYRERFTAAMHDGRCIDTDNRSIARPFNLKKLVERAAAKGAHILPTDARVEAAAKALTSATLTAAERKAVKALSSGLELDALADEVELVMVVNTEDGPCPVGSSKQGGTPDLPEGVRAPAKMAFLAQLDLSEVAAANTAGLVPKTGLVFVFVTPEGKGKVVFSTKPPKAASKRVEGERLVFSPRYMLGDAVSDCAKLVKVLPLALQKKLKTIFKDVLPLERFMADRVFGAPVDMQATGDPFIDWSEEDSDEASEAMTLLWQQEYGDGFVLVGVPVTKAGQTKLEGAVVAYTGT